MSDVFEFPGGLTSSIVSYLALNDKQALHLFHGNKQTEPKQIRKKTTDFKFIQAFWVWGEENLGIHFGKHLYFNFARRQYALIRWQQADNIHTDLLTLLIFYANRDPSCIL